MVVVGGSMPTIAVAVLTYTPSCFLSLFSQKRPLFNEIFARKNLLLIKKVIKKRFIFYFQAINSQEFYSTQLQFER